MVCVVAQVQMCFEKEKETSRASYITKMGRVPIEKNHSFCFKRCGWWCRAVETEKKKGKEQKAYKRGKQTIKCSSSSPSHAPNPLPLAFLSSPDCNQTRDDNDFQRHLDLGAADLGLGLLVLSSLALGVRVELAVGGLLSLSGGGSLGEALVVHNGVLGAVGQVGGAIGGGGGKLGVSGGSEGGGGGIVLVQVSPGLSAVGVLDGLLGGALVAVEGLLAVAPSDQTLVVAGAADLGGSHGHKLGGGEDGLDGSAVGGGGEGGGGSESSIEGLASEARDRHTLLRSSVLNLGSSLNSDGLSATDEGGGSKALTVAAESGSTEASTVESH